MAVVTRRSLDEYSVFWEEHGFLVVPWRVQCRGLLGWFWVIGSCVSDGITTYGGLFKL